jgi:hypothetical protein
MQRTVGNARLSRMLNTTVQAKLTVGAPNDIYEQEADRVADAVMRLPEPQMAEGAVVSQNVQPLRLQRFCPVCQAKLQRQPMDEEETEESPSPGEPIRTKPVCPECEKKLQRQPIEEEQEEQTIQAKEVPGRTPEISPGVESYLNTSRGGGQALAESTRTSMETRFGGDFSGVRVHTDSRAVGAAGTLNAQAFTRGQDIYFGTGRYQPGTPPGQRLLAHELTHVVQQGGSRLPGAQTQAKKVATQGGAPSEQEKVPVNFLSTVQRMPAISASATCVSRSPDEEETPKDVEEPTVDPEAFVEGTLGAGPPEDVDEALRQNWIDQIEHYLQRSDADFITGMLGIVEADEFDVWKKLEESVSERAYHFRVALLLRDGTFTSEAELDELIEHALDTAEEEDKTLAEDPSFADQYAWAFPATWSARVEAHLKPPSDLELARAESAFADISKRLSDDATAIPPDVYEQGLPVPFAQALKLTGFPFRQWYADLGRPESLRNFASDAKEWVKARVKHELAKGWLRGKGRLVEDIAQGLKVIDTDKWHLVSEPRNYQPDLDDLVSEARAQDISLDVMDADEINGWEYELALAKVAAFVEPFQMLTAWTLVHLSFSFAMAAADTLVAHTESGDRIDVADRWADNWGYGAAALKLVKQSLEENAADIVVDIAKDALISAIPIVGWLWRGKELIEEAVDLYDAGMKIYDARERAEAASTVVALQRAAAEMSMAEYSAAATAVLTAVSEGVSTGVGRLAKGKPGAEPDVGSKPGTPAPAEAGGAPHAPSAVEGPAAPDVGPGRAPEAPADLVENVTPATKKMFDDNPELKKSLQDNPRAAAALKKCKSPCYPEYATEKQIARIDALLAEAEAEGYSLPQDKLAQYFRSSETKAGLTLAEKHAALDDLIDGFEDFKLRLAVENLPSMGKHLDPESGLETSVTSATSLARAGRARIPTELHADGTVLTRADFPNVPAGGPGTSRPAPPQLPPVTMDPVGSGFPVAGRPVSRSDIQNADVLHDYDLLVRAGVDPKSIRINQRQVSGGAAVGTNRPDLSAELPSGQRVHIEYDRAPGTRAMAHAQRILTNDPDAIVILKIVDFD